MSKIIEKDNKKYLISKIYKKGNYINAQEFFNDLQDINNQICKELKVEHLDRKHPTQRLLNKFSGNKSCCLFNASIISCSIK